MPKDLIGLAAWLHRQSCSCQAVAATSVDPELVELAVADAELFQHASDIIKQKADEQRKRRALVVDLDFAARAKAAFPGTRRPV